MVYSHLRKFFSLRPFCSQQEINFLASVNTLAQSHTNVITFVCASSVRKNWRSTKSWFSCEKKHPQVWIPPDVFWASTAYLTDLNLGGGALRRRLAMYCRCASLSMADCCWFTPLAGYEFCWYPLILLQALQRNREGVNLMLTDKVWTQCEQIRCEPRGTGKVWNPPPQKKTTFTSIPRTNPDTTTIIAFLVSD